LAKESAGGYREGDGSYADPAVISDHSEGKAIPSSAQSQGRNSYVWLSVALFFLVLVLVPLFLGVTVKSTRNSEVSFQGLQTDQIVEKIKGNT
jgi:hypothetical protein